MGKGLAPKWAYSSRHPEEKGEHEGSAWKKVEEGGRAVEGIHGHLPMGKSEPQTAWQSGTVLAVMVKVMGTY